MNLSTASIYVRYGSACFLDPGNPFILLNLLCICKAIALHFGIICQDITCVFTSVCQVITLHLLLFCQAITFIMGRNTLPFQQLSAKMLAFTMLQTVPVPPTGWLKALRLALGMSSQQLAKKLSVTRQGVYDMERREKDGSITIKALREIANALDMQLVYGFVPKDGSLDALVDRKAKELAKQIVLRTSNTMKLEDQENSQERIGRAIEERKAAIKSEMPKALWD
jgi:predicted DNA-binding mobile mystery protein A